MNSIALYIHIPFCKSKCLYCDFCSYPSMENDMVKYSKALADEIAVVCSGKKVNNIFIGGGTPTYLSLEAWDILGDALGKIKKEDNIEFTVECNPGTIDEVKLKLLKSIGVNRISIGLQAWQDKLLSSLGRIHNRTQFKEAYKMIRNAGFTNVNVDIMFGLPNQSLEDFKETLYKVTELSPEHISCYSLIVEEGTEFGKMENQGKLILPTEDEERSMYNLAIDYLLEKGFNQYEISNFSKKGFECKQNIVYWSTKEYIGCGAGAHSFQYGFRYSNEEDVNKYIEAVKNTGVGAVYSSENSIKDNMEEFMFMGLRMINGVSQQDFKNRFNISMIEVYGKVIEKYIEKKLLCCENNRVYLTREGIQLSNSIMSDFII